MWSMLSYSSKIVLSLPPLCGWVDKQETVQQLLEKPLGDYSISPVSALSSFYFVLFP